MAQKGAEGSGTVANKIPHHQESDSTKRVWERVQGDISVHDLDELYKYCN